MELHNIVNDKAGIYVEPILCCAPQGRTSRHPKNCSPALFGKTARLPAGRQAFRPSALLRTTLSEVEGSLNRFSFNPHPEIFRILSQMADL
jgi:hypothetical protein